MALKDLLDGIENIGGYISGEYGKIGQFDTIDMETRLNTNDPESSPRSLLGSMNNPQSYQANGAVITGQQSFERPLEEPLPIQEVIVGYGLRTSSQNFIEDTFANGFTANMTSTQFNDLGEYNDDVSFGNVTYTFPGPVNFFDKAGENPYVQGFTIGRSPEGIGPSSDTDFLVVNGESSTFNPTIDSFTLDNTDSIFQSNLFIQNSLGFTGFNATTAFRRQSSRIDDWDTTPSNFITQDDVTASDITSNIDYMTAHKATITTIDNQAGSVDLNLSAGRGGSIQYPNSFTQNSIFDGDGKEFTIRPKKLEQFANDRFKGAGTDSGENRVVIIPVNSDGTALANPDVRQQLSKENQKGFRNYIQEMSPGKNSPFIVKKVGSSYGLEDLTSALANADLQSGTGLASWMPAVADFAVNSIGGVLGALDNIGGGFVRGTPDTISGRVHREIDDVLRKGKFLFTGTGLIFGLKQFGLQLVNRTIETRVWNPISLFSTDFYHMKRHVLGIEYEDLMRDPVQAMKDSAPKFIEPVLEPIFKSLFPTIGDGKSTSRTALQVKWVDNEDAPFEQYIQPQTTGPQAGNLLQRVGNTIRNAVTNSVNKLLNKGTIALHNPNHYFRIGGVVDPYKGPEGSGPLEDVDNIITKATTPGQATTFYKKTDDLEQQYNNYAFKTYGQIKDAATDDKSRNIYSNARKENLEEKAPVNPVADVEIHSGIEAQMAEDYKQDVKDYKARILSGGSPLKKALEKQERFYSEYEDRVNSTPLVNTADSKQYDFIDFYFKAFQWKGNNSNARYLQFSAVINNINETITPEYSEQRYLGRPDKYYIYNGVDRDVSLEFTLYPHNHKEMPFVMEKLNYLVGLCYPQYSTAGFMISPNVELTVGDMFRDQPGYIQSLSVNVQDNTTWEIERFQFPKHISATLTFRYFGKHIPHQFGKHYDIPYLTPFKAGDGTSVGPQEVGALGFQANYDFLKKSSEIELYKKSLTRRRPTDRFGSLEQDIKKIGEKSARSENRGA